MVNIMESVTNKLNREEVLWKLADQYSYFLKCLKFDDPIYMAGMKEARTKFVANTHIAILVRQLPPRCKGDWRYTSDFVSARALELLTRGTWESGELQYDHMVPKTRYIRDICEKVAEAGSIEPDYIYEVLNRNLWCATIHREENCRLTRSKMPKGWDEEGNVNIFARYETAKDGKIELLEHNTAYLYN